MIKHVGSVLCREVVIDQETNQASLFNLLEAITIFDKPAGQGMVPLSFEVFSLWIREDENIPVKGFFRLRYCDSNGAELGSYQGEIDLTNAVFHRTRVKFPVLTIADQGRYNFFVDLQGDGKEEWQTVATLPLQVIFKS